jgi:iron(II)-dependent oxidoreductase
VNKLSRKGWTFTLVFSVVFIFLFLPLGYNMFFIAFANNLEGKVLKVNGEMVEIDLGSNDGLTKGIDGIIRLTITANGKPVVLDIAKIKITEVGESTSKARITRKTSNVQAGYIVIFSDISAVSPSPTSTTKPVIPVIPTPTDTPVPVMPTPTDTPKPVMPTPTDTPVPVMPTPTDTPVPVMPTPTDTPVPVIPTPTDTPKPAIPSATPVFPTEKPVSMSVTTVEIKTDPSRARVYLEGALIGRTPLKLTNLIPGNYLMTVTIDDLMWEEQITINQGDNLLEPKFKRIPYIGMVYIPSGEFTMGSDEQNSSDGPSSKLELGAYYIDRCEVTMAEYAAFIKATGYKSQGAWDMYFKKGYENYPVVNVTWNDARSYAEWAGKRLPTEAEWEKASRGPDGRLWPWGNEWDKNKCINTTTNDKNLLALMLNMGEGKGPVPVGSVEKGMSPYGAMDMAGNVAEWIADWYQPYPYQGPYDKGNVKTIRGGSWYHYEGYTRCYSRIKFAPDKGQNQVGFRCVKDL